MALTVEQRAELAQKMGTGGGGTSLGSKPGANHREIRRIHALFMGVETGTPMSVAQISAVTGINPQTVQSFVNEIGEDGQYSAMVRRSISPLPLGMPAGLDGPVESTGGGVGRGPSAGEMAEGGAVPNLDPNIDSSKRGGKTPPPPPRTRKG